MTERFADYQHDVYHCRACHRVVRLYDSDCPEHRAACLEAHVAFNCTTDPGLALLAGAGK